MKTFFLAIAFGAALIVLPGTGHAFCAKVEGHAAAVVHFDCGSLCFNNWTIKPGEEKCRPDRNGDLKAHRQDEANLKCTAFVSNHEYLIIHTPGSGSSASISCGG